VSKIVCARCGYDGQGRYTEPRIQPGNPELGRLCDKCEDALAALKKRSPAEDPPR